MKHKFLSIFIMSLTTLLLVSCKDDSDINIAQKYTLNVTISLSENYMPYIQSAINTKIEAVNQQNILSAFMNLETCSSTQAKVLVQIHLESELTANLK